MDFDSTQQFYSHVPSLQNLSGLKSGLHFWRREISKYRSKIFFTLSELFFYENHHVVVSEVRNSPLPSSLKSIVEEHAKRIGIQICNWAGYHHYHISIYRFVNEGDNFLDIFDHLIWRPNGTICYGQTAKNILANRKLNNFQRFKLACLYCLEDEIIRLWPAVSMEYQITDANFDTKPFVQYWLCRLLNQFEKFPLYHFNDAAERMIYQCGLDNWPGIIFFWRELNEELQAKRIGQIFRLRRDEGVDHVPAQLPASEWEKLAPLIGAKLMNIFIDEPDKRGTLLLIWFKVRRQYTADQFLPLFERLVETENNYDADHRDVEDCATCAIWTSSPVELKEIAMANFFQRGISNEFLGRALKGFPRNVSFFMKILESATHQQRFQFWNQNWHFLIRGTRPAHLRELLKICLVDENDIARFKCDSMADFYNRHVLGYATNCIKQHCYEELERYLDFCYSSSDRRMQLKAKFKQKLLRRCIKFNAFDNDHILEPEILVNFIRDTFQNIDLANKYENNLVFHMVKREITTDMLVLGKFREIKFFVTTLVSSDETMTEVKRCLLDRSIRVFEGRAWVPGLRCFKLWCSEP